MKRRHFLRGAGGVAVGLPFLEGLAPRRARGATSSGPKRFVVMLEINGIDQPRFWPKQGAGALQASSFAGTALADLADYAERLLIPRGFLNSPNGTQGTWGTNHHQGIGHKLTCVPIDPAEELATGISVDQVIAKQLNDNGRPALSLRSGGETTGVVSYLSYFGPLQPAVGEVSPWLAYQDLVGLSGLDEEQIAHMVARRTSVLDLVGDEFDSLIADPKLSAHDKNKLDMHVTAIRDLELDMLDGGLVACNFDAMTVEALQQMHDSGLIGYDQVFPDQTEAHIQLIALAMACGANSAATLLLGSGAFGPIYTWDGMSHIYNHHKLSHGNTQDDDTGASIPGYEDMIHDIDSWHARQFRRLLDLLDGYEEEDGTVLDNSIVVWANELSSGLYHTDTDLPFVIAGTAGGQLKTGEYLEVSATGEPITKLWTTCLNAVGCRAEDGGPFTEFGDMTYGKPGQMDDWFV